MRRGSIEAGIIATFLLCPALAGAQADADLRRFAPPPTARAALATEPTDTQGPGAWSVGSFVAYDYRALAVAEATSNEKRFLLRHRWSFDTFGSVGVGEHVELALVMPAVLYQNGEDPAEALDVENPPVAALGDIGVRAKLNMIAPGTLGGTGLALLLGGTLPTATDDAFLGGDAVTGEGHLAFEVRLLALTARGRLGARVRSETTEWLGDRFGSEVPWAAGLSVLPQALNLDDTGQWLWHLEAKGIASVTPEWLGSAQSPIVGSASASWQKGDFRLLGGVEIPLRGAVGVPVVRAVAGIAYSPTSPDQDGDGIPDDEDICPELAEDHDGYDDADGCPDFDDDNDGVGDEQDRCRDTEEDLDGFQDDDGCPDPDNDSDGVLDEEDACPMQPGAPAQRGCPTTDSDADGRLDHADRCPEEPEDLDGFQDDDGCPDPDNDRDAVPDAKDACPRQPAQRWAIPELRGCPNPDEDGDTWVAEDACPREAEDFDGDRDEDGCRDDEPAAQPLLRLVREGSREVIIFTPPVHFPAASEAPENWKPLRALGALLAQRNRATAYIAVAPGGKDGTEIELARARAKAVVQQLVAWSGRTNAAQSIDAQASTAGPEHPGLSVWIEEAQEAARRMVPRPLEP